MSHPGGATANHASVGINHALNPHHIDAVIGMAGAGVNNPRNNLMSTGTRSLLQDASSMGHLMQVGRADMHESAPHATTSLSYAIDGTARVFADTVTTWMLNYKDPMKLMMGTLVVPEEKVIITREYVVGGGCQITAERSLAPVPQLKEDQREVFLDSYGADVMVNNNIAHKPALFQKQLGMLMGAQRIHLEERATSIMYNVAMTEGTSAISAYQKASAVSGHKSPFWRRVEAEQIYHGQQFALVNRFGDALRVLMGCLSRANKYTPNNGTDALSVAILPSDFLHKDLTRPSKQWFMVSGTPDGSKPPVPTPMPNTMVLKENPNIAVGIHHPRPMFDGPGGAASEQVMHNHLARDVGIALHYPLDIQTFIEDDGDDNQGWHFGITNFKSESWAYFQLSIERVSRNLSQSLLGSNDEGAIDHSLVKYDPSTGFTISQKTLEDAIARCEKFDQSSFLNSHDPEDNDEEPLGIGLASAKKAAKPGDGKRVRVKLALYRPNMRFNTLCGIFACGTGAEIGAYLVAYPKTMVASTQFMDMTRIGLRIAFGAALFARDRVVILEDIMVNGIIKGHGVSLSQSTYKFVDAVADEQYALLQRGVKGHDLFIGMHLYDTEPADIWKDPLWCAINVEGPYSHYLSARATYEDNRTNDRQPDWPQNDQVDDSHRNRSNMNYNIPSYFTRGTVVNGEGKIVYTSNSGLGDLDHPLRCASLKGFQRPQLETNPFVSIVQ